MRQLSGLDASFIYLDEPNADTHGTFVLIYDPSTAENQPIRFKDILAHIETRLSVSPLFRQKLKHVPLDVDYPYWVDDPSFDLEYHVRHVAVPKPGDWRQFCILASRLHAPPIDMSRPPWEMYVVEGLDNVDWLPPGSFALLIKAHHAAMDGHSAAELTMGLHDLSVDGSKRAPVREVDYAPDEQLGLLRMATGVWKNWMLTPWKAAIPGLRSVPMLGSTVVRYFRNAWRNPARHEVTRFNHKLSPHRVFTGRGYPLNEIRQLRLAVPGATINDTVVSIAAGATRHYLETHGELTGAPLRVAMPINTRAEEEFGEAGNSISAMFAEAHVDIADPLERLAAVHESTREAKELSNAIGAREMTDVTRHSPVALTFLAMKTINGLSWGAAAGAPFANFCLSNVPGPSVPLYLCGAELKFWNIVAPLPQTIGLFFGVGSYRDQIFVGVTADRKMVPDPELFEACLDRSFAEHVQAAAARFESQPELLEIAAHRKSGRRHPGLAAMSQMQGGGSAPVAEATPPFRKGKKLPMKAKKKAAAKRARSRTRG